MSFVFERLALRYDRKEVMSQIKSFEFIRSAKVVLNFFERNITRIKKMGDRKFLFNVYIENILTILYMMR